MTRPYPRLPRYSISDTFKLDGESFIFLTLCDKILGEMWVSAGTECGSEKEQNLGLKLVWVKFLHLQNCLGFYQFKRQYVLSIIFTLTINFLMCPFINVGPVGLGVNREVALTQTFSLSFSMHYFSITLNVSRKLIFGIQTYYNLT